MNARNERPEGVCGGRRGATSLEYVVLLAALFAAVLVGAVLLGGGVNDTMNNVEAGSPGGGVTPGGGGSGAGDPGSGEGDPGSGEGDPGSGEGGGGSGTTPDPLPMKQVFFDDFQNGNEARWHFSGPWQTTAGQLQAGPVSGVSELRSYVSASHFSDGRVSFDTTLLGGSGFGLFFHVSANPINKKFDGYSFEYDGAYESGSFVIRKWVAGVPLYAPLAAVAPPAGFVPYGTQRHFEVTTVGDRISVTMDGSELLSLSDGSYASGGAGFRLWNQGYARFDNVNVQAVSR